MLKVQGKDHLSDYAPPPSKVKEDRKIVYIPASGVRVGPAMAGDFTG